MFENLFRKKDKESWRDGTFLTTVNNSIEADILESKLLSEGIPVMKRYSGAGNAMEIIMGTNNTSPVDLYVPSSSIEDARNIIVAVPLDEDFDEEEQDAIEDDTETKED